MAYLVDGIASGYNVTDLCHDRKNACVSMIGNYPDGGAEQCIVVDVKLGDGIPSASAAMTAGYYGAKFQVKVLTPWATVKTLTMGGMMILGHIGGEVYLTQVRFYNTDGKCYTMQMRTDITETLFDEEVHRMTDYFAAKSTKELQADIVTAMQALL